MRAYVYRTTALEMTDAINKRDSGTVGMKSEIVKITSKTSE